MIAGLALLIMAIGALLLVLVAGGLAHAGIDPAARNGAVDEPGDNDTKATQTQPDVRHRVA
jgi:hypothetical protein